MVLSPLERPLATFELAAHLESFVAMETGRQTVYPLPRTPEFDLICSGDRLEFGAIGSISVGFVRRYADLEALLEGEGWENVAPELGGAGDAVQVIPKRPEWKAVYQGVLAVRVRETSRK